MAEDFAVLDFALIAAAPRTVARALANSEGEDNSRGATSRSLLSRLLRRDRQQATLAASPPLLVQPPGTLPKGVLAREMLDDMGFGGADREIRLSAPVGRAGFTLIEFRERADTHPSPRLTALSCALADEEILAFRLTGGQHPGGEFAFTVFRGGNVQRRLCMSRSTSQDKWHSAQNGSPHPLETEAPSDPNDPAALMPPTRQAAMLAALGIDADQLLVDRTGYTEVLELSTRPGGTSPDDLPEVPDQTPCDAAGSQSWEDEVTTLLVNAVTDALAEEEQVPWLDAMTEDLEAGRTEQALERARKLLQRGTRPESERKAAADRLATLFGH